MTTPQAPKQNGTVQPDIPEGAYPSEACQPELLTRSQIQKRFNLKTSTFNRMRKLPGFPERILPGTRRGYRYDPYEVKFWLDSQEAIRRKCAL